MKNEDKWIQDIRNRMEDYSEPLPAGMWEQLESELDTPRLFLCGGNDRLPQLLYWCWPFLH